VTAWTGSEALFLGGDPSAPCPPSASCVAGPQDTTDGAAFDPDAGTWRTTATAPEPIATYSSHAVLGGRIYLWGERHLLSYDPSTDTWHSSSTIPAGVRATTLAVLGQHIVAVRYERPPGAAADVSYDPATNSWSTLPNDPLGASFDRSVTSTPNGLVLTGHELVANPGAHGPSVVRAAVLDAATMTWRRLPDSDQLGGAGFTWTGQRLVDPTLGGEDGGQVGNYGRTVPDGGTLDPASGRWGRLPHPPPASEKGWNVYALGTALSAADGWIYNDDARSWTRLDRPDRAPQRAGDAVWAGRELIVVGGVAGGVARSAGAWSRTV
jgi:hypothetical protein